MASNVPEVLFEMEVCSENMCFTSDESYSQPLTSWDNVDDCESNIDTASSKDIENNKENETPNRFRCTKEQSKILEPLMYQDFGNAEETSKAEKWEMLATELNQAGPSRSVEQWKKIVAARKYAKKVASNKRQQEPSNGVNSEHKTQKMNCCSQTAILMPLVLEKLDVMTEEIRKGNDLLKEILEK